MSIQENAQQRDLEKEDFVFAVTNEIQGIKFDAKKQWIRFHGIVLLTKLYRL